MNSGLKIRTQLLILSAIFMALLISVGVLGTYTLHQANVTIRSIYEDRVVPLKQLKEISDNQSEGIIDTAHRVRDGLISPQEGLKAVHDARQAIRKHWDDYTSTYLVPREVELIAVMKPQMEIADAAAAKLEDILRANDTAALGAFATKDVYTAFADMRKTNDQLVDVQLEVSKDTYDESVATAATTRMTMIVAVLVAILLGGLFAARITRNLTRALGAEPDEVKRVADAVARGDLAQQIALRPGDSASVMAAMKSMSDTLQQAVATVRQNAEGVATASAQIFAGNSDLSSRTEQQAAALEETAASMEQIQTTVRQNADSAVLANQMAHSANSAAGKGGQIVADVVTTMKQIDDASRQITDIIGVIDGIAFQTNILALNAAVEAARAGDQGRGFAVVASEVRSLAGRSAEAAKQIKALIAANASRVEAGTVQAAQAGEAMNEIVLSIQRVTDLMGEISAASKEQSTGVGQVAEAVTQMDQVTQQNAALVEESTAAAESLKAQAARLVEAVSVFQLARDGNSSAIAVVEPAQPAPAQPVERRGPNRAKNVTRISFGLPNQGKPQMTQVRNKAATPASSAPRTGTDDNWASF